MSRGNRAPRYRDDNDIYYEPRGFGNGRRDRYARPEQDNALPAVGFVAFLLLLILALIERS